jgi:hypothetical protein
MELRRVGPVQLDPTHGASHTSFIAFVANPSAGPPRNRITSLFREARRRARRRRLVLTIAAAALAVGRLAALDGGGGTPHDGPLPARGAIVVPAQRILVGHPFMAVACHTPNRVECNRVAFGVSTRHRARAVRVTLATHSFVLDDDTWSERRHHGLRTHFAGFLQAPGLLTEGPLAVQPDAPGGRYIGRHVVVARARVVVTGRDGTQRQTSVRVELTPGFG